MKTPSDLILGLSATAAICQGQITSPGWYRMGPQQRPRPSTPTTSGGKSQSAVFGPLPQSAQGNNEPSTPVAEVITPQIQALADGLQHDPVQIFDYVHDHIKFVLYFGSKKGAQVTLLEKSGNDFDQSSLLLALLKAAGYTNTVYQFGWMWLPYDDPNGYDYDLRHWWQLTLTDTNWHTTWNYLGDLVSQRGYPTYSASDVNSNYFLLQRTWVALTIGATTYNLDPAFKISEP